MKKESNDKARSSKELSQVPRMKKFVPVFIVGLALGLCTGFDPGEAGAAPDSKSSGVESADDLPKSGVLSASGAGGPRGWNLSEPWGGVDAQGAERSPISGSVSRQNDREWVMRLFNNSEDPYAVTVQVKLFGSTGGALRSETFSYSLKPGASADRVIRAPTGVSEGQLSLLSWKNLAPKTDVAAKAAAAAGSASGANGSK